jgi:hypothetical protein
LFVVAVGLEFSLDLFASDSGEQGVVLTHQAAIADASATIMASITYTEGAVCTFLFLSVLGV